MGKMKLSLVLLAAGNSTRFQGNKLLYSYQEKPLITYVFDQLSYQLFDQIIVVTQYEEIHRIAKSYGFQSIQNDHPEKGIGESIHLGVSLAHQSDGCMFLVADQPGITRYSLRRMCEAFDCEHIICASENGILKNPMLFPKKFYKELSELKGDQGGKQIAIRHVADCIPIALEKQELMDVDTREQLFDLCLNK